MRFSTKPIRNAIEEVEDIIQAWWFHLWGIYPLGLYFRLRHRFLFLPKVINGQCRWLEVAWWKEEKSGFIERRWLPLCWVDNISKELSE